MKVEKMLRKALSDERLMLELFDIYGDMCINNGASCDDIIRERDKITKTIEQLEYLILCLTTQYQNTKSNTSTKTLE